MFFDQWMQMVHNIPDLAPANYGEMSGNPSREFVSQYMDNIFQLMAKSRAKPPYYLVVGGGIANFTMVDRTLAGLADSITSKSQILTKSNVKIYARRGGPNYQVGLDILKACCANLDLECHAFGPETAMTSILDMIYFAETKLTNHAQIYPTTNVKPTPIMTNRVPNVKRFYQFTAQTTCAVVGSNTDPIQNMLDFDYQTGRTIPSVVCLVDVNRNQISNVPVFWGQHSMLLPVYPNFALAMTAHTMINGIVNFASYRSAYATTMTALCYPNIKFVSILAESMAENQTRDLITCCHEKGVVLLGPSTIGAIIPGKFRIGNAGGKIDYLVANNLHRCGIVGIATRSGGLLNELCHMVAQCGLGIASAIAIGGDQYMGTTFADVVATFEADEAVRIILLLGEIGGMGELDVAVMVQQGLVTKPVIGLCLGTAANYLNSDIQFGHAGASASQYYESASYKNSYMSMVGIRVPSSWSEIAVLLTNLAQSHDLPSMSKSSPTHIPIAFAEAISTNLTRKTCNFFSSISDERGPEVMYDGRAVSEFDAIGDVIARLWFKRELPEYVTTYYEKILVVLADHGPCVSGAQNTIITTRAGKDLVSSLCAGLLTIGPKFGGAVSDAAMQFYYGMKNREQPSDFVRRLKTIPGIGHKHYSVHKPDNRVVVLSSYVDKHFTCKQTVDFARSIEAITVKKKPNLILNADGFIAASIIDGFFSSGFTVDQIQQILSQDMLNGFLFWLEQLV